MPAEARGVAVRTPVQARAITSQRGAHPRALEQHPMQFRGKARRILRAQQQHAADVLVDFGLEFELQKTHRPVMTGIPREAHEVAHALERGPAVRQVAAVQCVERIGRGEARQHCRFEEQPERHAGRILGHQQLLISRGGAEFGGQRAAVGQQEVRDVVRHRHVVDALEQVLQLGHDHGAALLAPACTNGTAARPASPPRPAARAGRGRVRCRYAARSRRAAAHRPGYRCGRHR